MSRQLIVTRDARADIADAVAWYRERSPESADRLRTELESVYASLVEYPEMYPIVYRRFRRALLRKFPFAVFFVIEPDSVLIVAVTHQARDENAWKRRS